MRVVKDGAGTIRLSKTNQKHFGGVEVLGGTVLVGTTDSTSLAYLGVRGSEIVVRGDNSGSASATSGVLDFEGVDGYTGYRVVLDGGAVHNAGLANVTDLRLASNSWIKTTTTTAANGTNYIGRADSPSFVDLGGHTLSARVASGRMLCIYNATLDNGLLDVVSGGWFGTRGDNVATNASLRTTCGLDVNGTFQLRDYTHLQTNTGVNRGDGVIDVYGTFSTAVRLFHGTLLHDGATIDLATNYTVDAPLPTVARFSSTSATATGDKTLRFEPGATIGVKIGDRKVSNGTCLISWDDETAPDSTVKFVRADEGRSYGLVRQNDGLYVLAGFMLIVR